MYLLLMEIKEQNFKATHIYLSRKQNSALNNSSHGFHLVIIAYHFFSLQNEMLY